ncbi:MAG: A/G-specific adenine glycosylase [Candidatus Marinimicrobia bacterium]|nr:A/G-specific adenine glycosylase [Candidatus Neomarinimicrobiota bacterium]
MLNSSVPVAGLIIPTSKPWRITIVSDSLRLLDQNNFTNKLLLWFHTERASVAVPGRTESDPYAIWIAEVMLQQTQVTTVWPYYRKWFTDFPEITDLAEASLDHVLKLWEGLGYYSRARNLHKAANYILEEFEGRLPSSVDQLLKIPGIGPYTAAAIASLAFGQAVPLIDGNVLRVFSRLERINENITRPQIKAILRDQLSQLISVEQPAAFNQGLMDLGRVICTPKHPNCESCPIAKVCGAFQAGRVEDYPVKPRKSAIPHYNIVIGLIKKDGQILIQKRPPRGLLGGLWEFPGGKIERGESPEVALLREIKEETTLEVELAETIGTIRHAYTHFRITLVAFFCDWRKGEAKTHAATENRWISMNELDQFAFPKANLKILELLKR